MSTPKQHFLGQPFDIHTPAEWQDIICNPSPTTFDYIVTPNVDHVVQISRRPEIIPAYSGAKWCMCDSRIIGALGKRRGLDLGVYPGADLVRDLFTNPEMRQLKIAIIGPQKHDFDTLCERMPHLNLTFIDAPVMSPGSEIWEKTLAASEASGADIFMICLSFPKQEFFAQDLKRRGKAHGIGLCVGASIDFITDRQTRAPEWVRSIGAEWAYRLLSNPTRMWKRYVLDGPKIFMIFLKDQS